MSIPSKEEIDRFYAELPNKNYYQTLGVEQTASKLDITRNFRELVSIWHIDRFGNSGYDDMTIQKVRNIFQRINDAYRTLSNQNERTEYDRKLEGRPDVNTLLINENKFLRGQRALRDDKIVVAKNIFDEVCNTVPDDPNYLFHKLYVDYLLLPKTQNGEVVDTSEATQIYKKMLELRESYKETKDWVHEFIGVVALGLGDEKTAKLQLKKARELNPNNANATQRLRLMERRSKAPKNESGSFLDTIKGWFSKK